MRVWSEKWPCCHRQKVRNDTQVENWWRWQIPMNRKANMNPRLTLSTSHTSLTNHLICKFCCTFSKIKSRSQIPMWLKLCCHTQITTCRHRRFIPVLLFIQSTVYVLNRIYVTGSMHYLPISIVSGKPPLAFIHNKITILLSDFSFNLKYVQ